MFSPTIQSLIDSSGREAALKRSMALNTYVNSFEKVSEEFMPKSGNFFSTNSTTNSPSFAQVLTNVASPSSKVQDYTFGLNVLPKSNLNLEDENFFSQKKYETKDDIKQLISQVCEKYKVDSKLVNAIVKQESGFNPHALSKAGAQGLMQLMPETAKSLGVSNAFDIEENVEGGVKYLKSMLDKYNGNIILALAAYNAGSGNVSKYNGVPPFKETQTYIKNILANYLW